MLDCQVFTDDLFCSKFIHQPGHGVAFSLFGKDLLGHLPGFINGDKDKAGSGLPVYLHLSGGDKDHERPFHSIFTGFHLACYWIFARVGHGDLFGTLDCSDGIDGAVHAVQLFYGKDLVSEAFCVLVKQSLVSEPGIFYKILPRDQG